MTINRRVVGIVFIALISLFTCKREKPKKVPIWAQQIIETEEKIPLKVTFVSPTGSVEGKYETFKILVGFNQPMSALQAIPREETEGPLEIEPSVKGKYRWLGTRTLAFILEDTLPPATEFKVTLIKDKIQSLTGMRLERDTSWTFESVRPTLLHSSPYNRSTFLNTKSYIYLHFNLPMAPYRIDDKIRIIAHHGKPSPVWRCQKTPEEPYLEEKISFSARNLMDEEKKGWQMRNWKNENTLVLIPHRDLPEESKIEVYLLPGLLAKTGNLGLSLEKRLSFNTYNFFTLISHSENIAGDDPLILCFSNPVKISELVNNIKIEPPVEIPEEYKEKNWNSTRVSLYLPFKLNSEYRIKVNKNLKDEFGNVLNRNYEFTLKVGDYKPYASIPTGISLVESKESLKYPATFVNVDSVHYEMAEIELESAIPFLNQEDLFWNQRYIPKTKNFWGLKKLWKVNTYKKYRNKKIRFPIELKELLKEKKNGLVFIQFDNLLPHPRNYYKAFLEVTDLGVTWKYSPENNFLYLTSLKSATPLKDVKVQFRDNKNRILYEGKTDQKGFLELPGWAEYLKMKKRTYEYESEYEMYSRTYRYEPILWITLSKGEDTGIYSTRWNFGISPWRFNISYNWNVRAEEYGAYIFTEKGLYKSGEKVHIKGILRKKKRGEWILPVLKNIYFTIKNSRDEEILKDTLSLNQYGAFSKFLQLQDGAPTGVYSISVEVPQKDWHFSHYFRVEAYRPAEFEVKVFAKKDTFIAGEEFKGSILGKYLFGLPMKSADVRWSLTKASYYLRYNQHKGYTFGGYFDGGRMVLGSGSGKLNEKGEFEVNLRLPVKDFVSPSSITLEGTVTSPDKKSISGRQNWLVFNSNLLIGLKTSEYIYTTDDTVKLSLLTIRPNGKITGNKRIKIEIFKEEWKSIKKARLGGRYEWVSERVKEKIKELEVKSKEDSLIIPFVIDKPGYYYVLAETEDKSGRKSFTKVYFYIAGKGHYGWFMRDDDIVELVADKDEYEVGDTAKILVKSPYDSANALITLERELILDKFTKKLRGNADYIKIPIKSTYLPNIYVSVILYRGRVKELKWDEEKKEDLGKPQFKIGYVNLQVSAKEKHLRVKTWSDKKEYRPRDTVNLYFEVKDYNGKPVKESEVALFVVDLGVLNLIDFKTPDPFSYFYGSRPLSVKTVESRLNIIGERSYGEKGEERGGGGMKEKAAAEARKGISYREKFIATVYYNGELKTDADGTGKVKFVLPDNLTKFRIMAITQTKNSEFGSAESTFVVHLPFIISPSIPRFLRVGDEFKAGIVLHNRTKSKEKVEVKVEVEGIKLLNKDFVELSLSPESSKEVLFSFNAIEKGTAVFKFIAEMNGEKDALKLKIPVKFPPFTEAVATFSSTLDSALQGIIVPENIHPNIGGLEISLSSSILAGMKRGIEHLLDYPYGCLEQRISRILPLIVGEEIINQFKLAKVTGKELRDSVQKVLDEVPEYQLSDGGFVYFKGGIPSPYLSAYTMFVLRKAYQANYSIPSDVIERGLNFLRDVLRWEDVDWLWPYNEYAKLATKTFCLYSLSLWGEKEKSYASRLFERREQIPIFGKTLLLKAGRNLDMGKYFENELARIILNKIKFSPTTAHFEESENRGWTFPSPAKVTGFVIQTFTELNLKFPYKDQVIRWLVQERGKKSSKPTTHENAFVFDAFQTYYKKYEKDEPDFIAKILMGQKEILKETFKGRTNEPPRVFSLSLKEIPKDTLLPLRIFKKGKGRLYYVLRMAYALKENPFAFDEGFYVWKEILTLNGKEVREFKRGEVYKIILHVAVPETRIFAVLDDPLPAGFEPVQTYFATESEELRRKYWQAKRETKGHWWGSFRHKELHNDRVLFFAEHLFPGEHTVVYFIRAGTKGKFLSPSTKVEEMYSPEVFGSTPQGYVVIE